MVKNFWRNKKVLITGYEGFLGSHLSKTLLGYGAKIVGIDKVKSRPISVLAGLRKDIRCIKGNIINLKLIKDLINKYKPHVIFHLAAEPIVAVAVRNPITVFRSNIQGTWNILEGCRGKKFIKAIIVASSDKAYGNHKALPYKEDYALKGKYPYDVSKSCADLLSYAYFHTYGLPVCITRCANIYGPGDFHFSRVVPDTIRSIIQNKTLIIRSDGKFTRDYIYIDDIARGHILLAEKIQRLKLFGEAFNFGNEKPISVLELVKTIYKLIDKKPTYKILNQTRYEIKHQYLRASKAKRALNWRVKYTLEEGLKRTIKWYREFFG